MILDILEKPSIHFLAFRVPFTLGLLAAFYPDNLVYIALFLSVIRFPKWAVHITIAATVLTVVQNYIPWYQHFIHRLPAFYGHHSDLCFFVWAWLFVYHIIFIMAKMKRDNEGVLDAIFDYGQVLFFLIMVTALQQMF